MYWGRLLSGSLIKRKRFNNLIILPPFKNMIVYGKESYDIVGAAFEVYNKLGHGFLLVTS